MSNQPGKWGRSDVPHAGWRCFAVEKYEDGKTICEMCEYHPIKYIHFMSHPDFENGATLRCGCVCAGQMEGNMEAAATRDRDMRNADARKKAAAKRKEKQRQAEIEKHKDNLNRLKCELTECRYGDDEWPTSKNGNPWHLIGGHYILVFPYRSGWKCKVDNEWGETILPTCNAAKIHALEYLIEGLS